MTRLYDTISVHFYHFCLKSKIEAFIQSCNICQCAKLPGIGHSHLPPRDALIAPWYEVAIDLIGPWQFTIGSQVSLFQALTCIDTVTNLAEVIRINNKSSKHISMLFENNWLARYPCPSRCIHDYRGEFTGAAFSYMLRVNGIKDVTTTVKNPQANAIANDYTSLSVILYGLCYIDIHLITLIKSTILLTLALQLLRMHLR